MQVYISGPLQGAQDLAAARSLYEELAEALIDAGHSPYVPHLHTDPEFAAGMDASAVYHRDVAQLLSADVVVAHVGAPSTGVGAELAIAVHHGIDIVAFSRIGESVSRFAEGLLRDSASTLLNCLSVEDCRTRVVAALADAPPSKCPAAMGRDGGDLDSLRWEFAER